MTRADLASDTPESADARAMSWLFRRRRWSIEQIAYYSGYSVPRVARLGTIGNHLRTLGA